MDDDRSPESLIEAQLCQTCGHHLGADHNGQVRGRAIGDRECSNCDACASEYRGIPPTMAAMGIADAESAWPEGTSDPADVHPRSAWVSAECDGYSCKLGTCGGQPDPCGGCCNCLGGCEFNGPAQDTSDRTDYWTIESVSRQAGKTTDQRELLAKMTRDAEGMQHVDGFEPRLAEGMTPKRAHDILMGVTGQPQYPTQAEMDQDIRDALAGKHPMVPAVPAPIAPCGCTNVRRCRAHAMGPRRWERESSRIEHHADAPRTLGYVFAKAAQLTVNTKAFTAEFDAALADAAVAHFRAEDRRLAAAIPTGLPPGETMLLELKHETEPRLTVQVLMDRGVFDRFPELAEQLGQAMMQFANTARAAVVAAEALVDPETGKLRPPTGTPCACSTGRTCRSCLYGECANCEGAQS